MGAKRFEFDAAQDAREFALYLRRLADAVERGEAYGRRVMVERRDESTHSLYGTDGDVLHRIVDTGEEHQLSVSCLRHVYVRRCADCGDFHDQGRACDSGAKRDLLRQRWMSRP